MKQEVKIGQTDYTVLVHIRDTDGAAKTALVHTDIDIAYARVKTNNEVTTADVSPATLANLAAAHSDWGFLLVSDTDHPGLYRLDIADAVFASGAWSSVVTIVGTGLDPTHLEFVLVPVAPYDGVNAHQVSGTTPDTSATLADAIWDEALSGHTTAGTAGKGVSDAGSAGNPWSSVAADNNDAGTMGKIVNIIGRIFQ